MREPQQNENKTAKQNNHNARSHANVLLAEFSVLSSVARAATLTELRPPNVGRPCYVGTLFSWDTTTEHRRDRVRVTVKYPV